MRLFTALWPPDVVLDEIDEALVDAALVDVARDGGMRWTARARRHVTLCFHGDADPEAEEARLRDAAETVSGPLPAPRLRAAGAGSFRGVLWTGIEADDPDALAALVRAAGADPAGFVAHLTIARGRRPTVPGPLEHLVGSWWRPDHVALVASGQPYRTLARVPLGGGEPAGEHR